MAGSLKELSGYRFSCSQESLEDAQAQIERAERFLGWIEGYLQQKNIIE